MTTRVDYDTAWKGALGAYFRELLQMLRLKACVRIDWTHPPKFLSKGLRAVSGEFVKAWLLNAGSGVYFGIKFYTIGV